MVSQLHLELINFSLHPWFVSDLDKPKDIYLLIKIPSLYSHQFWQNMKIVVLTLLLNLLGLFFPRIKPLTLKISCKLLCQNLNPFKIIALYNDCFLSTISCCSYKFTAILSQRSAPQKVSGNILKEHWLCQKWKNVQRNSSYLCQDEREFVKKN